MIRLKAPAHAVSVFGPAASLCDRWFETELRPFLTGHRQLAIISQKRKIGVLRENVIAALERRLEVETASRDIDSVPGEATEALREGDRALERAQGEPFFLTRKIAKMHQAIIDIVAQRIAAALSNSEDADAGSIFSETLTQMILPNLQQPLFGVFEHTRDKLMKVMQLAAATSGHGTPGELPRTAGMPMLDVHEISQRIVVEKPRMLLLLGQGAVVSTIRRQMEQQYDRALLAVLSLYANRLRRWMEESVNALCNAFNAYADMYRAHFEAAPRTPGLSEESAIQNNLRILVEWNTVTETAVIRSR
jgi:hypothetical protein